MQIRIIEKQNQIANEFIESFIYENNLSFIGEGECFSVYNEKSTSKIIKIQKTTGNSESIKEVTYWTEFCIKNQASEFISDIKSVDIYKFNNKNIYTIETTKLRPLPLYIINDLNNILRPYISKDITTINRTEIDDLIFKLSSNELIKKYINNDFYKIIEELINYIKIIAKKQGDTSFNFDLHYKNIMINPNTNRFVIVDFFNCSTYEVE